MKKNMNPQTYILVHGAWHAAWCWERVAPILKDRGHRVIVPDLPGHGNDKTPFQIINLSTYVDRISELVLSSTQPVILVGHSMAGVIISQIAENIPEKISRLVYVAAFIPMNNESLVMQARKSRHAGVSTEMQINESANEIELSKSGRVRDLFFNSCDIDFAQRGMELLQKEPFRPFIDTIHITNERFGSVRKTYIECMQDEAIRPEDQKRMYEQTNCEIITLENADHSPFYSAHEEMAQLLENNNLSMSSHPEEKHVLSRSMP